MCQNKNMAYKHEIDKLIKQHGRTRKWISSMLNMDRTTFWRNVNKDTFTKDEKNKVKTIIITGICK